MRNKANVNPGVAFSTKFPKISTSEPQQQQSKGVGQAKNSKTDTKPINACLSEVVKKNARRTAIEEEQLRKEKAIEEHCVKLIDSQIRSVLMRQYRLSSRINSCANSDRSRQEEETEGKPNFVHHSKKHTYLNFCEGKSKQPIAGGNSIVSRFPPIQQKAIVNRSSYDVRMRKRSSLLADQRYTNLHESLEPKRGECWNEASEEKEQRE
ncbi:uncharacterized protein LOC100376760 [Saccoglossus kowalevskii]|uniref:Uncharacterized protein LOC100376760 n=1 Tax=Saccoglossus kowalevskii TaxID=10224 RepID=A0ABM0GJF8_SACKO|nr:PREDICTED: uncharacterized protein LOC100376760 [Saccoglossus kowalevskii]